MSDYTAIEAATQTLKRLLENGANATVTVSRPDIKQSTGQSQWLNLFLYQVTENQFIANQEDPRIGTTRDYGKPPLSLNLRYLLTPYATDTDETGAHRLLGAAMLALRDNAIVLPGLMIGGQLILDARLADAIEHLRISLAPITLDDLSKIWTGAQESMRLSVAYEVAIVQIDSTQPRVTPLPVRERNVVVTLASPRIASIDPNAVGVGDAFVIRGSGFFSQTTQVLIGSAVPIDLSGMGAPTLRDDAIQLTLADDPALWPGAQLVRVQVGFDQNNSVATGAFPKTMMSEPAVLLVIPKITGLSVSAGPAATPLTINGKRLYRAQDAKNIFVQIGSQTIPASQFTAPGDTAIGVTVPPLPAGKYPVVVRYNAYQSQDDITFQVT